MNAFGSAIQEYVFSIVICEDDHFVSTFIY